MSARLIFGIALAARLVVYEVHQILLALNGIHILENMNTEEIVKDPGVGITVHVRFGSNNRRRESDLNPIAIK